MILHVGDHDPSGESIFTAMTEDAAAFVEADRVIQTQRLEGVRVALTTEQVEEHNLATMPPKRSDRRSAKWSGETCQLEALPPDTLAEIIENAIEDRLDPAALTRVTLEERADRAELLALPRGGDDA